MAIVISVLVSSSSLFATDRDQKSTVINDRKTSDVIIARVTGGQYSNTVSAAQTDHKGTSTSNGRETDRTRGSGAECVGPLRVKDKEKIIAGGDFLRSLLTLPSVTVANGLFPQLNLRGIRPSRNAVCNDGVSSLCPPPPSTGIGYLRKSIAEETLSQLHDWPAETFGLRVEIAEIDCRDPRQNPVLPNDEHLGTPPVVTPLLSAMSIEKSERTQTPYPYTDKGNHMCRDLLGYLNLKKILKNDILAAGTTYLLAEGFEMIEPQIDGKVLGPNHYDPLFGAAGYTFKILQKNGIIPQDFWWSIIFYTDENPIHNAEHKPMQAELYYTVPTPLGSIDFKVFYDNYGHSPTTSFPYSVRVSSMERANEER